MRVKIPSNTSRIAELSAIIAEHTKRIDDYLTENQLAQPTFSAAGPVTLGLPPDLEQARLVVLDASQELNDLLQGPREIILNHQHILLVRLRLIAQYNLATEVPLKGSITFRELAAKVGVNESALTRILRLAIAHRIFTEPSPGVVAHSAASRLIADDPRVNDWIYAKAADICPAGVHAVDALIKWPSAEEPNQTGFALANNSPDSFYVTLGKDPEKARRFGSAMSCYATGYGYSVEHFVNGFPWSQLGPGATVVDVGGSLGDMGFALARRHPQLKIIVQDLPEAVVNASAKPGVNVQFMEHDFFQEQPLKGADVFNFRWIMHNWPDSYCVKILRALVPALKQGARVLIMDFVLPPPGAVPNIADRRMRAMDVTMLEIANAKERDIEMWESLFTQADSRFAFKGATLPPGSNLSIIEASWEP